MSSAIKKMTYVFGELLRSNATDQAITDALLGMAASLFPGLSDDDHRKIVAVVFEHVAEIQNVEEPEERPTRRAP